MPLNRFAKELGRLGGLERAKRLSSARKKEIATKGGHARSESLQTEKRIENNFRYLSAIREMATPPPEIRPLKTARHKLPGTDD